jgi:hypothetical protein
LGKRAVAHGSVWVAASGWSLLAFGGELAGAIGG